MESVGILSAGPGFLDLINWAHKLDHEFSWLLRANNLWWNNSDTIVRNVGKNSIWDLIGKNIQQGEIGTIFVAFFERTFFVACQRQTCAFVREFFTQEQAKTTKNITWIAPFPSCSEPDIFPLPEPGAPIKWIRNGYKIWRKWGEKEEATEVSYILSTCSLVDG